MNYCFTRRLRTKKLEASRLDPLAGSLETNQRMIVCITRFFDAKMRLVVNKPAIQRKSSGDPQTRMRYSYACVVQLYRRAQIGSFLSLITWRSRGSGGGDEWRLWWRCWLCVCPPSLARVVSPPENVGPRLPGGTHVWSQSEVVHHGLCFQSLT